MFFQGGFLALGLSVGLVLFEDQVKDPFLVVLCGLC